MNSIEFFSFMVVGVLSGVLLRLFSSKFRLPKLSALVVSLYNIGFGIAYVGALKEGKIYAWKLADEIYEHGYIIVGLTTAMVLFHAWAAVPSDSPS